ncbi:T9SS C-terminal target domain-containing protein [candidate division KSB1 bacterium]|nr:MAG: T9SS C-terminal target domain-containing protein [candidate division KSB1 bacterium]
MKPMLLRIIMPLCFIHTFCLADGFRVDLLHSDFSGGPLLADTALDSPLADGCAIEILEDFGMEGIVPITQALDQNQQAHNSQAHRRSDGFAMVVNGSSRFDAPGFFFVESALSGDHLPRHPLRIRVWNGSDAALASAYWESPPYSVLPGQQQVSFTRAEWTYHEVSSLDKNGEQSVQSSAVAEQYELLTAYPNPFNSSAQIVFSLERAGSVELSVYDLQGRHERTLLSGPQTSGQHQISFDGSALPTGVYFVSLRTDERAPLTRKLVLMR